MPIIEDQYVQLTKGQIQARIENELETQFGEDIDLSESSTFSTFASVIATVDANQFEPAVQDVFESAFLDSAEGQNLENVVELIGLQRQSATHATGIIEFDHGTTSVQDYNYSQGIVITTTGSSPVEFETSETANIYSLDTFENGSLRSEYNGDRGDFSVSNSVPVEQGTQALTTSATSTARITDLSQTLLLGRQTNFHVYLESGAKVGHQFGVQSDGDSYYEVVIDSGEHTIQTVVDGSTTNSTTNNPTVPEDEYLRHEIEWFSTNQGTITSRIVDSSGNTVDEVSLEDDTIVSGGFAVKTYGTGDAHWDLFGDESVRIDIRAAEGGGDGNVGTNALTVLPVVPSGVNSVTNPFPTGNDEFFDTSQQNFIVGDDEEEDDELRERARESFRGGRGTISALISEARALDSIQSVTVYENDTDSTDGAGLEPTSFELLIFGGSDSDIAEMLHNTKGLTAQDQGGVRGTRVTFDYTASNGQEFTYEWSEPNEIAIDMTLELVVNDSYIGDDDIRDLIVREYIGGTALDGSSVIGLGVSDDVYIDQLEDVIVGPDDTGVIGINQSSTSYTPSTTTDSNGLTIIDIGANEVASTNASDMSITINTTEV